MTDRAVCKLKSLSLGLFFHVSGLEELLERSLLRPNTDGGASKDQLDFSSMFVRLVACLTDALTHKVWDCGVTCRLVCLF